MNQLFSLLISFKKIQLQKSFALLVSFSSLSSEVNQQLVVTNEGRNPCWEADKLNVEYIFVETFDFLLLWEFLSSFLHSIKDRGVQQNS